LNAAATVAHVAGDEQGMYKVTLTTDDTDTLGTIAVTPNKATLAGSPWRGNVLTQAAWDALHTAADGRIRSDLNTIKEQTITCGAAVTIHPALGTDHKIGTNESGHLLRVVVVDTTTTNTDMRGTDDAAKPGDEMDLIAAPNATAVAAIQDGLATPTNITAGTITTVTNLTNAPTSGDLTATMKASVNAEVNTALNTAIPGSPTADSINERVATMDGTIAILQGGLEDV